MPHNAKTWVELLLARGTQHPEALLYRFLHEGDVDGAMDEITYGRFLARVQAIAAALQARDCAGERALLLYPPGIDFIEGFFGCLFAGVIAVPAYPPDPTRLARTLPRLRGIVADAQPRFVLTTSFVAQFAEMLMPQAPELAELHWMSTDELSEAGASGWRAPEISPDTLAFLQYTSGSTGRPKGVMLSHHALLYNVRISTERLHLWEGRGHHMVSWLPQYHDMGLIGTCLNPVCNGYGATMMSPMSFLQKPVRWVQALSHFRGTVSAAPNFAYDLVSRKIKDHELAALDLSPWKVAVNGAEPVRAEVGERFLAKFGPAGFAPTTYTPSYGMAEATLFISSKTREEVTGTLNIDEAALRQGEAKPAPLGQPESQRMVSCGKPVLPQELAIVDTETLTERPPLRVGEIWLRGESNASGYWRREEESRYTFGSRLQGRGEGTWLRTGDLGFLDEQGELYVTGRAKDLIIVRGANHYPQDIEATVEEAHPAMRPACSAAFTLDVGGQERLVIAAEADPRLLGGLTLDELVALLRGAVAEAHGIQPYAITLLESRSIPKTTSGKIQRHAAKMEYLDGSAKVLGQWTQTLQAEAPPEPETQSRTPREIADWLTRTLSSLLGVSASALDRGAPFTQHGLDSLQAVELVGEFEEWLGLSVPVSAIWDYPSILSLAAHFGDKTPREVAAPTEASGEPIAVVGLGCRFPGAPNPEAFWRLLRDGVDAITPPPPGRWASRLGGYVAGVEDFDPEFFGISPREAVGMDPQQRLLLEVTFEALESAGIAPERLAGTDTGVFVGISSSDYALISLADPEKADAYSGTGNAHSIAANRLSYLLDLRGPSVAVDTACSSSLVALHLAVQALRSGEIRCAIVGGVNLLLSPQATNAFAHAGMLAADGRCKTFDASADGYVRGEGCGVVVLERVSTARERGDTIRAVIRGTAVNQDGRSNGLTAPNGVAQQKVVRAALAAAGLGPESLGYIEAHGTGTPLGDPIEIGALNAVIGERDGVCVVGSVKTNIGHLEAAAGMASLVKVVLSMEHGEIPPQLHFRSLNKAIQLGSLEVADRLRPWPTGGLAGVSGFGFGGTNAHAIVEAAPPASSSGPGRAHALLTLSARSPASLRRLAAAVGERLASAEGAELADLCYAANVGRSRQRHRLALLGERGVDMAARLAALDTPHPSLFLGEALSAPKVAFLFTGQGSQYADMGKELYAREPVFRETLDRCDALLGSLEGSNLLSLIFPADAEAAARLNQTAVTQPALFSLQVALAALWRSWGVTPDVVTGHSVGAYAAAVVCGALSLEDGLRLVAARGRLMGALPEGGTMAAVRAGEAAVAEQLALLNSSVEIAAINGPEETVISGMRGAMQAALAGLKAAGLRAVELQVSHAFHSALMDPMLLEFTRVVAGLRFEAPAIPFVSDHTGAVLEPERMRDPLYWRDHLRRPVRFAAAMETIGAMEPAVVIEIGPNPVLLGMARRILPNSEASFLPSLRRGREETMLAALAGASVRGVNIDFEALEGDRPRRKPELPTSPYQRRRLWVEHTHSVPTVPTLEVAWTPQDRAPGALAGDWLVLGDLLAIAVAIEAGGGRVVRQLTPGCRGVIDLRPLESAPAELRIARTLATLRELGDRPPVPLFVLTRGAVALSDRDEVNPDATALWGLLRAYAAEHPDRWGGLIDVEDAPGVVLAELAAADGEQVAWRGGRRHVARLRETQRSAATLPISEEGWVLVTGGLGGLGLRTARWLFTQGARRIALLGRGGARSEAVDALERDGAELRVFAADVADEAAMRAVIEQLPGLRGVVHAAGVVERRGLAELDEAALERALRAKVGGSRVLDALTSELNLDFFWFFSSVSAIWGGQGLLAYAAANAFEDGLAARRVAAGKPALSLGWGVWADGGMASEAELAELARIGLRGLRPEAALERLRQLSGHQGVLAVADVDWSRLRPVLEARRTMPILSELGQAVAAVESGGELSQRLAGAVPGARRGLLIEALRARVREVARLSPDAPVPLDQGFFEMGIDSLMAVEMQGKLAKDLGRRLPATLLMDQPNLGRLVEWLLTELSFGAAAAAQVLSDRSEEPIAVIGMACRLPGGADSPEALWELLQSGRDAVREVPAERWDIDAWYDPSPEAAGKMITRRGGFIDGIDQFDAGFFGITAREAARMDPQHRLLLELSVQALERAGAVPEAGSATGVFVGIGSNDYLQRVVGGRDVSEVDAWTGTGNASAFAAGRLAYHLGLQGPAVALDTACSSSLVATHLACQSLRAGECSLALAAGVSLMIDPKVSVYLSRARALAPDGKCKTFDAAADGYARGEGGGVVVLKRLSDALRDGDLVHAVIRGSAVNHDGRSSGITVPNGPAQQAVIRRALESAGVAAESVGYIEAHGTGTGLGDPIEVGALDAVLGRSHPLTVGTVKSNIGHLEAAAGIAGLIKAVLCVQRGQIPPNLHFHTKNPHIDPAIPLEVPTSTRGWAIAPRVAGVSAFGLSGTNAHLVLSEAPAVEPAPRAARPAWILPLSAATPAALSALVAALRARLDDSGLSIGDLCYSVAVGRGQLPCRAAVVGASLAELARGLDAVAPGAPRSAPELAFVFNGAASLDPLLVGDASSPLMAQLALARRLVDWGLSPAAVVGEGAGRLAAACFAGVYSPEQAAVLAADPSARLNGAPPQLPLHEARLPGLRAVELGQIAGWTEALSLLAELFESGQSLRWFKVFDGAGATRVPVPTTVFQRKRYWLEATAAAAAPVLRGAPFLGERLRLPLLSAVVFEAQHSPASPVWLGDHRLFGRVVTPGAAHIALSLEAARVSRGLSAATVAELAFSRAMVLGDQETRALQIVLDSDQGDAGFRVASLGEGGALVHAAGRLLAEIPAPARAAEPLAALKARLEHQGPSDAFYARFDKLGYTLGPAFRWMGETWRRDGEALCRMNIPSGEIGLADAPLHPGLIDSCFQLLTRCLPAAQVAEVLDGTALFVPVAVERFSWLGDMSGELYAHAVLRSPQVADITLQDATGTLKARIDGLKVQRVPRAVFGGGRVLPDDVFELRWRSALLEDEPAGTAPQRVLVLADEGGTGAALARALGGLGKRVSVARRGAAWSEQGQSFVLNPAEPEQWHRLMAAQMGPGQMAVVHLWGLDEGATDAIIHALSLVRAMSRERLYLVTRGATTPAGDPGSLRQTALLGLQRTLAMERPALGCTAIDLDPDLPAASVAELVDELERASAADQVALRSAGRSVARLVERKSATAPACGRFVVGERGALESVTLLAATRSAPARGEVEIEVRATGLNFRDVLGALGAYPGDPGPLGGECTGVISAVGEGVQGLSVGDRVVTLLASSGCFRTHATSDARFVARLPDTLSFEQGATVPVAFATAIYGLEQLAGMRRGERVLIHAATGGVGMAAVQLALAAGAEVYATAGSASKRRVLSELGVQQVMNSRDLEYAARIRALGGVDLVLNSLGVDHVRESLALLREGGRFVEIGKADVLDAPRIAALGRGVRYFHFDLVTLSQSAPERIAALLDEMMARLAAGRLRPLPLRSFELDETVSAFRHMARARHVGKVVVRWPEGPREAPIRGDRSYLVTGGLGALGLHVAGWLVEQGATKVVLLGRGAPSPTARQALEKLGASVIVRQGDVSDPVSLARALNGLSAPIAGVFHCAGVLDDALIAEQDPTRVRRVMAPKVAGGWNLHTLLSGVKLDHFVLFSSVSAVLGSPGQASYSAANAWLNGLAAWRRSRGLAGLSVSWGPWAEGGMAEQAAGKGRWSRVGIAPLEAARGLEILGALMQDSAECVAVLPFDRARMVRGLSLGPVPPLMLELLDQAQGGSQRDEERLALRDELLDCVDPEERYELMVDYLCACLGTVTEEDEVDPEAPLSDNDSLVAVEFSALIESELGVTLATEAVFRCDNLRDLAELVLEKVG